MDDFYPRAEKIDREIKDMVKRLAQRTEAQKKEDEEWAEMVYAKWLKKHNAYVQDLMDRRVALEDFLRETLGPGTYEVSGD